MLAPAPMPMTGTVVSGMTSSVTECGTASITTQKQPASCSASRPSTTWKAVSALRPCTR